MGLGSKTTQWEFRKDHVSALNTWFCHHRLVMCCWIYPVVSCQQMWNNVSTSDCSRPVSNQHQPDGNKLNRTCCWFAGTWNPDSSQRRLSFSFSTLRMSSLNQHQIVFNFVLSGLQNLDLLLVFRPVSRSEYKPKLTAASASDGASVCLFKQTFLF